MAISSSGVSDCPGYSAAGADCAAPLIVTSNRRPMILIFLFTMFSLSYELTSIASLKNSREVARRRTSLLRCGLQTVVSMDLLAISNVFRGVLIPGKLDPVREESAMLDQHILIVGIIDKVPHFTRVVLHINQ